MNFVSRFFDWLFAPGQPTLHTTQNGIHFICEQDGPTERELKNHLCEVFQSATFVISAYLARVDYRDGSEPQVALAIDSKKGDDPLLVMKLSKIFASMFGKDVALDIIFVTEKQVQDLALVCKPFYLHVVDSEVT